MMLCMDFCAWVLKREASSLILSAREVGAECCVAQSLDASPIQHKAAQQTTQNSTIKLQEPRPGSQSVMQAHNSQQAQGEGINHLQPEKDWSISICICTSKLDI